MTTYWPGPIAYFMMTSSNGNIFHITGHLCREFTGEFPAQRPVTWSFDVFFDLRLNKRLSKQSWGWWSETPSHSLWRHCNELGVFTWFGHITTNAIYIRLVFNISLIKMLMLFDWWIMFIFSIEFFLWPFDACLLMWQNMSFNKSHLWVHFWVPFLNNVAINDMYRWENIDFHSHAGPFDWNIDYLDWDRHSCQ